jgi:hypothetical protein
MPDRFCCAAVLTVLLGATAPCVAQSTLPGSGPTAPARDPKACSDEPRLRGGAIAPQPANPRNETLSEKLQQTDGVLCPPNIDPDIKAPTPDGGKMPVIPPPGSPGGDPSVRPK